MIDINGLENEAKNVAGIVKAKIATLAGLPALGIGFAVGFFFHSIF